MSKITSNYSFDYKTNENAFVHWVVRELFDKEDEDARTAYLPKGKRDLGINALWTEDSEKTVYVCQAVYSKNQVTEDTINALIQAPIQLKDKKIVEMTENDEAIEKSRLYLKCLKNHYKTQLILVINSFLINRISKIIDSWNHDNPEETVSTINLDRIKEKYEENLSKFSEEKPNVELHVVPDQYFIDRTSGATQKSIVATIKAKELAEVGEAHKFALFLDNIRYDLGLNRVNKGIIQTLNDSKECKYFWHFNNGLSIVCDSFEFDEITATINLTRMQIVNGCQTTKTLARFLSENRGKMNNDIEILVRITETQERDLSDKIARYNNSQTEVKESDLLSNENAQKRLEKDVLKLGWVYLRQRGQERKFDEQHHKKLLSDKKRSGKVIEFTKTTQRSIAFDLQDPAMAKGRPNDIFGISERENFKKIFNDSTTAEMIVLPNFIFDRIRQKRLEAQEKIESKKSDLAIKKRDTGENNKFLKEETEIQIQSFIRFADFHILALFYHLLSLKNGKVTDEIRKKIIEDPQFEKNFEKVYKPIVFYLERVIEEKYKYDSDFSKENFFKSPESYEDIKDFFNKIDEEDIVRNRDRLISVLPW